MKRTYPSAPPELVIDDYHGTRVADPYRWLEDVERPQTRAWVAAQNAFTRAWLDGPTRNALRARLARLYHLPRLSVLACRGRRYFFTYNPGGLPQPILYLRDETQGEARVLVDPNRLSPDGTVALTALEVDRTGHLVAYGLSTGGSDWQELRVHDVERQIDLEDRLRWVKFASIAWLPDSSGFVYTRFPEPGSVPAGEEHYHARVCLHRLGDDQARDRLIAARPDDPTLVFEVRTTRDGRALVLTVRRGASAPSEIYVWDLRTEGPLVPLVQGFFASFDFIDAAGDRLYFLTDEGAARRRIVAIEPGKAPFGHPAAASSPPGRDEGHPQGIRAALTEVVAESDETLTDAVIAAQWLVVAALRDASHHLHIFDLDGRRAGELPLAPFGTVTGLTADPEGEELLFGWTSFTSPPTSYLCHLGDRRLRPFPPPLVPASERTAGSPEPASSPHRLPRRVRRATDSCDPRPSFDPTAYAIEHVWATSTDGTRIPMFLVSRRSAPIATPRPALLTGYGGFGVNMTPVFDPAVLVWLDLGGWYGLITLRGGGEYGEAWHRAGMGQGKPRVFDDFIAAAEWLVASGRTTPDQLAIDGASNGGLLVAACLVRRPDLFGAVICRVPVVDMLRYHHFTVGRFWVPEYGCADDPAMFPVLYAYSPYHRVREGTRYPATLVTTAEGDDRVHPGMAYKFVARLQAASSGDAPILLRAESRAGHGAGKPTGKQIEEDADVLAFLVRALDLSRARVVGAGAAELEPAPSSDRPTGTPPSDDGGA